MRGGSELLFILLITGIISSFAFKGIIQKDLSKAEFFIRSARTKSLLTSEKISLQVRNKTLISSSGQRLKLKKDARINTQRRRLEFYVSGAASPGSLLIDGCRIVVSLRGRIRKIC